MENLIERIKRKNKIRQAMKTTQQHYNKQPSNFFEFVIATSSSSRNIISTSRSFTKKRKVYKSNYIKKQPKKHNFLHQQQKQKSKVEFYDLFNISKKKPTIRVKQCLSIRNVNILRKIKNKNSPKVNEKIVKSLQSEKEDVQIESCYLKSKMIHECNGKNKKQMSLIKQKEKQNLHFVVSFKKKQRKTTRQTPMVSPFSTIID